MKKNIFKGFSLIELLVVVAIIGTLASLGVYTYNGYISGAKKTAAENSMQQIALMQTEYYSDNSEYYCMGGDCTINSCDPTDATTASVESSLFEGEAVLAGDSGYNFCVAGEGTGFLVISCPMHENSCDTKKPIITLNSKGSFGEIEEGTE